MAQLHVTRVKREFREIISSEEVGGGGGGVAMWEWFQEVFFLGSCGVRVWHSMHSAPVFKLYWCDPSLHRP